MYVYVYICMQGLKQSCDWFVANYETARKGH